MAKVNAVWVGKWDGGRVRMSRGRKVWMIERNRRVISLNVNSEQDARAELALFQADPAGYRTRAQRVLAAPSAAVLDEATLRSFSAHCKEQGLSAGYRNHILKRYLDDWAKALRERDLREVTLRELNQLLEGKTARHHRIVALKSLTSWLRGTARLKQADDPTMDLRVPTSVAEKSTRAKGYRMAQLEQVYAEVSSQALRDTLCLRAKAGMHDTEIARVASREAVLRLLDDPSGIKGTITFRHLKAGKVHVVSVDTQTFAAAERLAARGTPLSRNAAKVMLDRAAKRLTKDPEKPVEPIQPGELRHSFATWARSQGRLVRPTEGGVPLAEVAAVMGHLNPRTTKVFYEGNEVPAMIELPLKLVHQADPASQAPR